MGLLLTLTNIEGRKLRPQQPEACPSFFWMLLLRKEALCSNILSGWNNSLRKFQAIIIWKALFSRGGFVLCLIGSIRKAVSVK
jgi:hypothetical protein